MDLVWTPSAILPVAVAAIRANSLARSSSSRSVSNIACTIACSCFATGYERPCGGNGSVSGLEASTPARADTRATVQDLAHQAVVAHADKNYATSSQRLDANGKLLASFYRDHQASATTELSDGIRSRDSTVSVSAIVHHFYSPCVGAVEYPELQCSRNLLDYVAVEQSR